MQNLNLILAHTTHTNESSVEMLSALAKIIKTCYFFFGSGKFDRSNIGSGDGISKLPTATLEAISMSQATAGEHFI